MSTRIDLGHEAAFRLGNLEVRPSTRMVIQDSSETLLEPQVMKVLVALARAGGAVVSRDDLVDSCWDGRIVGDDAINRPIVRLRRLSSNSAGAFSIQTIPRVGYRLIAAGEAWASSQPLAEVETPASPMSGISRRSVLALAGTAAVAGAAGLRIMLGGRDPLPAEARKAIDRGLEAMRDTTPERTAVAVAAFRQAAEQAPDTAEPLGLLALAYQQQLWQSGTRTRGEAEQLEARAREAAWRALAIDKGNADAKVALVGLPPVYRRWLPADAAYRKLLDEYPNHGALNRFYGKFLSEVGRNVASIPCFRRALAADPGRPQQYVQLATVLWRAHRLDEADRKLATALQIWPRHYSVWFSRQRMLAYTGRGEAALAMIADKATRPTGIPQWDFDLAEAETRAILTQSTSDVNRASRLYLDVARRGAGLTANGIFFHAATGRIDDAFRLIEAYYFNRGFTLGSNRYSEEQGMFALDRQRSTHFLFDPLTSALRRDQRFPPLTRVIGLDSYWRATGTGPDEA